jgi:hypothetical protein
MRAILWKVALMSALYLNCVIFQQGLSVLAPAQAMNEQQIQDAAAHFTRPWSERRGIETIDRNAEVFLVRAPLNELSDVLTAQAIESRRDVMGLEIEISGAFVFAYQLVGQSWSIMVKGFVPGYSRPSVLQPDGLAQLSQQLQQPVIRLEVSDSAGIIDYDLFESGEWVEYFRGGGGSLEPPVESTIQPQQYLITSRPSAEIEAALQASLPTEEIDPDRWVSEQTAYFWSRRRQVTAEEIGNVWRFPYQLLVDYDAYDPALAVSYFLREYSFLRQGDYYRVQNPGITLSLGYDSEGHKRDVTSVPDLVRVDYFRFGN